jgi:hypothetical protein
MVSIRTVREIAMSLDGVIELPHFELTSFRVKKKIFLTMDESLERVCFMFSLNDQDVFCKMDPASFYAVPNKWGLKGATYCELKKVKKLMLEDAINVAYESKVG